MIGGIAGDIIGAAYEHNPIKTVDFPLFAAGNTFTDDSVLTLAVAEAILKRRDYGDVLREFCLHHPNRRYGSRFIRWAKSWDNEPSDSFGNGSAMRVAPVGWAFKSLEKVLEEAEKSAIPTHNTPEGIKGAKAVAASVFMARIGGNKAAIRAYIEQSFGYDLSPSFGDLKKMSDAYGFEPTCEKTVPPALIAFLDSTDWEDAVRKAVSLGWDTDTMACITGAIAEAYYDGVPANIEERVLCLLPKDLRTVADEFRDENGCKRIYGFAEVCQLCGTVQSYSSTAIGYATHVPVKNRTHYVCLECLRKLGSINSQRKAMGILEKQDYRFCKICTTKTTTDEMVCPVCLQSIPKSINPQQYLDKLSQFRKLQSFQEFRREHLLKI